MKRLFALVALIMLCCCLTVTAQDSTESSGAEGQSFFVIFFLSGGGFLGVITTLPIVILSFIAIALIIEHSMTLRSEKMAAPEVIVQLEEFIDKGEYDEALNLCEVHRNFVTNTVGAALIKANDGQEAMTSAAETQISEESTKLMHKISWLSLVGNIGPMLGLFGTVVGMVAAFAAIASSTEQPSPKDLAGGIFTALITTVWGLIVAIPSLSAYFIFKNKVQRATFELSGISAELIERCKPAKVESRIK